MKTDIAVLLGKMRPGGGLLYQTLVPSGGKRERGGGRDRGRREERNKRVIKR